MTLLPAVRDAKKMHTGLLGVFFRRREGGIHISHWLYVLMQLLRIV